VWLWDLSPNLRWTYASYTAPKLLVSSQFKDAEDNGKGGLTYDCNLAAEVIFDFARLDRIGGILGDHLVQV